MELKHNHDQGMQVAVFVFTLPGGILLIATSTARDFLEDAGMEFLSLDQLGFLILVGATVLAYLVGGLSTD